MSPAVFVPFQEGTSTRHTELSDVTAAAVKAPQSQTQSTELWQLKADLP